MSDYSNSSIIVDKTPVKNSSQNQSASSIIQVPDSSPIRTMGDSDLNSSPVKATTRLPSLREKFSYTPSNSLFSSDSSSQSMSQPSASNANRGMSLEIKRNFSALKNKYPTLSHATILSTLKMKGSLREASAHLSSLTAGKLFQPTNKDSPVRGVARIRSPHKTVVLSSSSPVKVDTDVKSSKVLLNNKSSILARYGAKNNQSRFDFGSTSSINNKHKDDDEGAGRSSNVKRRRLVRGSTNVKYNYSDSDDEKDDDNIPLSELKNLNNNSKKTKTPLIGGNARYDKKIISFDSEEDAIELDSENEVIVLNDDSAEDEDDDDDDVSEPESESEDLAFDDRVLLFLNTSDKRDLVDIAGITPTIAQLFIDSRPYASLHAAETKEFEDSKPSSKGPSKRKGKKKPVGEKIIETTVKKLRGYDTVESLIKKCDAYAQTITRSIKKWGVNVHSQDGELEIVEVDVDSNDDIKEDGKDADEDGDEPVFISQKVAKDSDQEEEEAEKQYQKDGAESDDYDDGDNSEEEDFITVKKKHRTNENKIQRHGNNKFGYFKQKPSLLSDEYDLKNYQHVGINWLNLLFQKNLSCILADEMGLGKTLQVIAFLAHLKEKHYDGPHLIVVPSSTLENWLREFQKFAPSLDVRPYYGSQESRVELREELAEDNSYDVLVTTYNLACGNKYDQSFLRSRNFNVVVYDEGHMLKNSNSDRYQKLMKLKASFRLLLTGTPLQNNLRELISLLSFILPNVFIDKKEDLQVLFDQKATTNTRSTRDDNDQTNEEDTHFNPLLSQQAITNARTMMAPFILRRKKDQVMKHLPAKVHHIEYCEIDPVQKKVYELEIHKAKESRKERLRRKDLSPDEVRKLPKPTYPLNPSNVIMHLRKAALHPMLFRNYYKDETLRTMAKDIMETPEYYDANEEFIFEDMQVMTDFELNALCHTFPKQLQKHQLDPSRYTESGKITKLLEILDDVINNKGEKTLIFSMFTQVLDILEKILSMSNYKFLRLDGQTSVDERQTIIDKFYDDDEIPIFLLSTKAGGFGINLVCANNVVIFDQSFNPHDDRQAEDRAHRVGQTKEVNVYRIICKGTIEENIYQLAENKLQLDSSMMNGGDGIGNGNFNEDKVANAVENLLFNGVGGGESDAKNNRGE